MAGDWIKMRTDLFTHPKVFKIAQMLGKDELYAVGALFAFWSWVDKHVVDGHVDGATTQLVDRATRVDGLSEALISVGWMSLSEKGISIPEFSEHNGDSAKERSLKNQRQARWRARKADGLVDTKASTNSSTREEKRREDIKEHPHTPSGGNGPEETGAGKPSRKAAIALKTFLAECKASGEKPIPESDPVFAYADETGIPLDFLRLHWLEFKERYCAPDAKRYKDWRTVHRKSVRGCWFRLWYLRPDGTCGLTTQGEQAKRHHSKDAP